MSATPALVVFSHLRWGFVYQRPQHLMSRLAGRWRVVFVEEPLRSEGPAWLEEREIAPLLTVLVPHTPVAATGFHDEQLALLEPLLEAWMQQHAIRDGVAWLYTPMALPLAKTARPSCLAFDCMDELSAFKDAPRQLRQRENALLKSSALVIAGGPSLYEARRGLHPNLECLPSSVDAAHFSPANLQQGSEHAAAVRELQGGLGAPGAPLLGYFGVIDERLDAELLASLADAHPDWQIVMVGPVVKIDPHALPQHANIHWLGMQAYERLPYFLAGWDVGLMPFALNESTRFISPTKTLEYMAGEKPVVSTAIRDVISLYGHAVEVAHDSAAFVRACESVLAEDGAARSRRIQNMLTTVSVNSWQRSADRVHRLLSEAHQQAHQQANQQALQPRPADLPTVSTRPLPAAPAVQAAAVAGAAAR